MKISELLRLRNEISQCIDLTEVNNAIDLAHSTLKAVADKHPQYEYFVPILDAINNIKDEAKKPVLESLLVIDNINSQISELGKQLPVKEYAAFLKDIDNSCLVVTSEIKDIIIGRIRLYANWRYPGMEVCPRRGEFTQHIVSCDPLYLVDFSLETLLLAKKQFTPEFQSRLREYEIHKIMLLEKLPQNQFGFVFSWNYFNYFPLVYIKKYLVDISIALRPGGVCMFSYNNCNTVTGATHAEWGGMSYVTKEELTSMCKILGFEIIESFDFETSKSNVSWIEIKKPGTLTTTKVHQTLGTVKNISE